MKQSKALLKVHWDSHKKTLLMPLFFMAIIYAISLGSMLLNLIRDGKMLEFASQMDKTVAPIFMYQLNLITMTLISFLSGISVLILADGVINGAYKRKCEIMHLSQPVSMLKVLLSKIAFLVKMPFLLFLSLSFFNTVLIGTIFYKEASVKFSFALASWIHSNLWAMLSIMLLASIMWFFATIFKRKSFFMAILVLFGAEIAIIIINYNLKLNIPSIFQYISSLLQTDSNFITENLFFSPNTKLIYKNIFKHFFVWQNLHKLLYSMGFFALGSFIYSQRELT